MPDVLIDAPWLPVPVRRAMDARTFEGETNGFFLIGWCASLRRPRAYVFGDTGRTDGEGLRVYELLGVEDPPENLDQDPAEALRAALPGNERPL